MEFCKVLKYEQIERVACVRANGKCEAISAVKKRTGADIVINAPIFNLSTYAILSNFTCDYKKCGTADPLWGFKFTDGRPPEWAWNAASAQHFISEFGLLVVDGAIRNSVSASPLSKRGRTAIGVTKAGEFVVYVVTDNETYARRKTAKELANKMLSLGCTHAVNLDGGGSSQVADHTGVYTSGRYVPGFLCIWIKNNHQKEDELMTVMATAKMNTYDAKGNRESGRYISKGDVCTIRRTIADNLLIEVEYPISAGRRTAYIRSLEGFKVV